MSDQEMTLDNFIDSSDRGGKDPIWKEVQLRGLVKQLQAGGTPATSNDEYYDGDIPWVKTGELGQLKIDSTEQTITERGLKESTARLFPSETVLVAMYGATTGEVSILDTEAATNQACCGIIPVDRLVPQYLYYQLVHEKTHLKSLSAGSGQQNISKSILEKYRIPLAPVSEQRKIATILYTVDQVIEKTEDVVEQADKIKKGLIQKFYSTGYYDHPEWQKVDMQDAYVMTRTDKLPATWEIKQSDDIAEVKTGHTPSTSVEEYWDGEIPWVDIHDLTQLEETVIHSTDDTITKEGLNNSGAKLLPEGTLVLCRTGAIGETAILGREMATDQDQVTFECDESEVLPRYLMYLFEYATPQLKRLSAGSTHDKVQLHFFSDLEIPLPEIDEQRQIVNAIESVDEMSQANKGQLDNLQRLKKGLMQDLLSGTVRTTDTNIEVPEHIMQHG